MTIYINGKFLTQNVTGVQRYAREVVKALDDMHLNEEIVILTPKDTTNDMELKSIKILKIGKLKGVLWEQISLPLFLKKKKSIMFLNLCNMAPILLPGYLTLHDISFKTNSKHLNWKFVLYYKIMTRLNIKRCEHIFTVSEFSKNEIIKNYHINENKITVAYNSAMHIDKIVADYEILKKLNLEDKEFSFSLGSRSLHKNYEFIKKCAKNNPNYIFVVTGDNNSKIFKEEENNEYEYKNIIYTGRITDEQMKALYSKCKVFIYPSLYEGFGIPPLEAIESGCKNIILSDIPVFREIYSDNVKYFDLNNEEEESKNILEKIEEKNGFNIKDFEKYNWNNTANIIMETMRGM